MENLYLLKKVALKRPPKMGVYFDYALSYNFRKDWKNFLLLLLRLISLLE